MKVRYLLILILVFTQFAGAAFENKRAGISQVGLSMAGVASSKNDFLLLSNSSLLPLQKQSSLQLFYKNYYSIKGLDLAGVHYQWRLWEIPLAASFIRYGNKLYSENIFTSGFGYNIGNDLFVGASLSVFHLQIKGYQQTTALGVSISSAYRFNEQLTFALNVNNLNEPKIGQSQEIIPVSGTLGLAFSIFENAEILVDLFKDSFEEFDHRFGLRILALENVTILTGFRSSVNSFSAGLKYSLKSYHIKYAIDVHPVLNMSHAIGFSYDF
jgi:hypothetical protein